jgi:Subtilase family
MPSNFFLKQKLVVFFFLFFTAPSFAQKNIATTFSAYLDTTKIVASKNTYLLSISFTKINELIKTNQLHVLRQIDSNVYIINNIQGSLINQLPSIFVANNNWKLSSSLLQTIQNKVQIFPTSFLITTSDSASFKIEMEKNKIDCNNTAPKNTFIVLIKSVSIFNNLLNCNQVTFISTYNNPTEEAQINTLDVSTNKINLLHSKMPLLDGNGMTVSIKENNFDSTDLDLINRNIFNPLASNSISPHATIMATMAAGAGNTYYLGKGVAYKANITSSSFSNLLPDDDINYLQKNITVQNHSYGVGIENFYGADAAAFDETAIRNNKLLFVFSAGNSGTITPNNGPYVGIAGTSNLTGSFKMAKNIITVGAVDSFNKVVALSSKGPAYDGRIKPEMVAYGEDGSSGAAALVSGTALIMQQAFKNKNNNTLPSAALVKAMLLNSCDDVGAEGIDFSAGFGSLNAYKAAEGISLQHYFSGNITNNASQTFFVDIPANISKAKFMLVWNDTSASANNFTAIQNDLDMQLTSTSTGQVWLPWVLNSKPNKDSLMLLPVRKKDSINTIEQITINNPVAGNYTITIKGYKMITAKQNFAIAYQMDTANIFNFTFPAKDDNIFSGTQNLIRWDATFANTPAVIEYSINSGNTWQIISTNINTNLNLLRWVAPDTNTTALLRIKIGNQYFVSDLFTISSKTNIGVGFNCIDSTLLFWNKIKNVNTYQLYAVNNQFLQPIAILADTQFVFNKLSIPFIHFAVAPIINNKFGVKSYAINYNTQAVDCYVKNLLVDIINNTGTIELEIGTTYLVKKIIVQKLINQNFTTINEINNISTLQYTIKDNNLLQGENIYRVLIQLQNGKIVTSYTVSAINFYNNEALIYPNPVKQDEPIIVKLKSINNQIIQLTNVQGSIVFQRKTTNTDFSFPANFAAGLYILSVYNPQDKNTKYFKIIIN